MIPAEILKKVRRIQILTSAIVNDVFAGQYHSAFKGRGMEFEDVREYQPGDDIRSIDWNVTARMGRPFIKNFREERELTVLLLVDVSASQDFGTRGQLKSELVAELGEAVAEAARAGIDQHLLAGLGVEQLDEADRRHFRFALVAHQHRDQIVPPLDHPQRAGEVGALKIADEEDDRAAVQYAVEVLQRGADVGLAALRLVVEQLAHDA